MFYINLVLDIVKYSIYTVSNYYLLLFTYYWYHRLLHCEFSGILYKLHYIGHHKTDFSLTNLHKQCYNNIDAKGVCITKGLFRSNGEIVFGVPVLLLIALTYCYTTTLYFCNFTMVLLWILISGEITHSSYHLQKNALAHPASLYIHNYLWTLGWFPKYVELHDIHHFKPNTNFGFLDMTMDKIFNTYCEIKPNYMNTIEKIHKQKII